MTQKYLLYYDALDTNRETFARGLFMESHRALWTALHCAFDLRSPRKLSKVQQLVQEQLGRLEEQFASMVSPLKSETMKHYRNLLHAATTRLVAVQNALKMGTIFSGGGHRFEEATTINERRGAFLNN